MSKRRHSEKRQRKIASTFKRPSPMPAAVKAERAEVLLEALPEVERCGEGVRIKFRGQEAAVLSVEGAYWHVTNVLAALKDADPRARGGRS